MQYSDYCSVVLGNCSKSLVTKLQKLQNRAVRIWGGSRGGSVEPTKLNVKTYNKRVIKKKVNHLSYGGDFRAINPPQIAPENAGNRISEAIKLKIFRGSMPPDPLGATAFGVYPNPPSSNPGSAPANLDLLSL